MSNYTCQQLREELGNLKVDFGLFSDYLQEDKSMADLDKFKDWQKRILSDIDTLDRMLFDPEVAMETAFNALSYTSFKKTYIRKELRVDRKRRAVIVPANYPPLTTLGYLGRNIITETDFKFVNGRIIKLPEKLFVDGSMYLENTKTDTLPRDLHITGNLSILDDIKKLPEKIKVKGDVTIHVSGDKVDFPDYFVNILGNVEIICHGIKTSQATIKKQLEKLKAEGKIKGTIKVKRLLI